MTRHRTSGSLAALAICLMAGTAHAQYTYSPGGGEVNISGATLFQDFFQFPASTNDAINVDGDWVDCNGNGIFDPGEIARAGFYDGACPPSGGPTAVDQLAQPLLSCSQTVYWLVTYRGPGSGNGLAEFVDYQLLSLIPNNRPSGRGVTNGIRWCNGGSANGSFCVKDCNTNGNFSDDSNAPVCISSVDIAVMDVPTKWFVFSGAAADARWDRKPLQSGYGRNTRLSTTGDVTILQSLARVDPNDPNNILSLNTVTSSPNPNTLYDTPVAFVPIIFQANRGTGLQNVDATALQHLYVTGRMPNGENLVGATRDRGSGTRNAMMNSLGVDPSFGIGDNVGNEAVAAATFAPLGPSHQATNLGGSDTMAQAVQNRRLAVGYNGVAGGNGAVGANNGLWEILNVRKDFAGATQFVRPSKSTFLHNIDPNTGWQFGGPETFTTRGDINSGLGGNTNPAMTNTNARDYIRNIIGSIASFITGPTAVDVNSMPGQALAITFFLNASIDAVQDPIDPTHFIDQTGTPAFNLNLQSFVASNNTLGGASGGDVAPFGNGGPAGRAPARTTLTGGQFYSDGRTGANGNNYLDAFGTNVNAGVKLSARNRIQGDFNYDGVRDINDITAMLSAIAAPRMFEQNMDWGGDLGTGSPLMTHDCVIVEVIGDMNGDGNFNAADVRYFADGLAISGGHLDRKAGFLAVDNAWAATTGHIGDSNYFDTVVAGPKGFAPGDSRADIAGNASGIRRGAEPTGADGFVNAKDVDYVLRNRGGAWSNINLAVNFDLSADINGDLSVTDADADELVHTILCTEYGDVNLDGRVNAADQTIVNTSLTTPPATPSWANGDLNGDGVVSAADMAIVNVHMGFRSSCLPCTADIDGVGGKTIADVNAFVSALLGTNGNAQQVLNSDQNGDGVADGADIQPFVNCYFQP